MLRLRLLVLDSLVMLVVVGSAIEASSASAEFILTEAECGVGIPTLCYENIANKKLFEFADGEELVGKAEPSTSRLLRAEFGGEPIKIECAAATIPVPGMEAFVMQTNPLTTAPTMVLTIEFTGCKMVEGPTKKCTILEVIDTNKIEGTFPTEAEIKTTKFTPDGGTIFAAITFENNGTETCPATIKGEKKVKGKQTCNNITPGSDATVHLIECTTAGSELTFGENTAEFDATFEIELKNTTDPWSIQLG